MGPYTRELPRYAWQLLSDFRARHERHFSKLRETDVPELLGARKLRILDLANGRLRPQYTLLRALGHTVYGVDLVNRPARSQTDMAYRVARRLYNWHVHVPHNATASDTLVCGDVTILPFHDASFDLVTSMAAFEHFLDVPGVIAEVARVLRPGGVIWACVHPFTAPSGGHNVTFTQIPLQAMPEGVAPWDHLRQRRLAFHVPLNEWRIAQYLETFAQHFTIERHYCAMREGEHLLTSAIQSELAQYSREELTCLAYIIVARKSKQRQMNHA